MAEHITLASVCTSSEDVVIREIEGDTLIVPLAAGIGDADDELYTVNETGQAILRNLDGVRTLEQISKALALEFSTTDEEIEKDVLGFVEEMVKRGILVVRT